MSTKITKTEFVSKIAEKLDLTQKNSNETIKAIFDEISEQLKQGNSFTWPGLGTLSVKERAERNGRNPTTGETIKIAARKAPHFKASKELKELVNCD